MGPSSTGRARADTANFNPPTSCEVGRSGTITSRQISAFQSTHLLRGGTLHLCMACDWKAISIHPPPARWDPPPFTSTSGRLSFQSTHLLRGGTPGNQSAGGRQGISIHPPPARWDFCPPPDCYAVPHFNPPTSCEVGRARPGQASRRIRDISIHPPPARWDMVRAFRIRIANGISIHPPPARWDESCTTSARLLGYFNPPTSCEVGRDAVDGQSVAGISIHPPPARWDAPR